MTETRAIDVDGRSIVLGRVDGQSAAWIDRIAKDQYEPGLTNILLTDLGPDENFVDVGAYVGYFSILAAQIAPLGIVHSFEMDRRNFRILNKNLDLNRLSNVEVHRVAITDRRGTTSYVKGPDAYGAGHQLGRSRIRLWNTLLNRVPTTTLDAFFEHRQAPGMVKIDVQGAELNVLRGMPRMLTEAPLKLIVEVHPGAMRSGFGTDPRTLIQYLRTYGFDPKIVPAFRTSDGSLQSIQDGSEIVDETLVYARNH